MNQKLALRLVHRLGGHADLVPNGLEAFRRSEATPYDVLLMDCQMPEMDGYEATRRLRALEQSAAGRNRRPAYIIAVAANAMSHDRDRCLGAGMDDYVSKPIEPEQLEAAFRRFEARIVSAAAMPLNR